MTQEGAGTSAYVLSAQASPLMSVAYRGYQVQVSREMDDPEWDAFLAAASGGNYQQSSLWAQIKTVSRFQAIRIVIRDDGDIVGGAQVLIRRFSLIGGYGYVAMGPLVASAEPQLVKTVVDAIDEVARKQRIHYLVVQPPWRAEAVTDCFRDRGFFATSRDVAPPATLLIDLTETLDEILGQMTSRTRQNIRVAERKGVVVREGTERDIPTVHRLLLATGKRHNFSSPPEAYYRELWQNLAPRGFLKLFLAEFAGEAVTALFVISFGDTAVAWRFGWSGRNGGFHPNELIEWAAMKWAKANGYSYFDIGGINRKLAGMIERGEAIPKPVAARNYFKLGFGGKLAFYPQACAYIYNPFLRWLDSASSPRFRASWPLKRILDLFH